MLADRPYPNRPALDRPARAWWLWLLLFVVMQPSARAAFDPYQVAIPVADQSASARRSAEREALSQVLFRLTGDAEALQRPELAAARQAPQNLFLRSGYARIRDPELAASHPDARWLLELEVDRRGVLDLLAEAGIPAWTGRRPEILVVMLEEDAEGERRLLEPTSEEARSLLRLGRERGLPLVVPLLDLQDQLTLDVPELWARFEDATAPLAERYRPDAIVILRRYQDALGRWLVDWEGEVGGESLGSALEIDAPEAAPKELVERLAGRLIARYALRMGVGEEGGEILWLQVDGLSRVQSYAGLMRYLEGVSGVSRVQLVQVRDRSLLLRLDSTDAGERLLDLLRLEARLAPRPEPEYFGDVAIWRARWIADGG